MYAVHHPPNFFAPGCGTRRSDASQSAVCRFMTVKRPKEFVFMARQGCADARCGGGYVALTSRSPAM